MTFPPVKTAPHCPPPSQILLGRQVQVGVPPQAAGTSAQNGAAGVHGGGSQPGPVAPRLREQNEW
jgi:hypothetical protein